MAPLDPETNFTQSALGSAAFPKTSNTMKTQIHIRALGALLLTSAALLHGQEPASLDRATALAEARAGKWERSEPALEALAATAPADAEVCAQLALRRLEEKRNKEAVALAERAAEAAPANAALHSLLGRAYGARIGELAFIQQGFVAPKMLRAFKRSVELDPDHVPGLIGLANYYRFSPAIAGGSTEKADEYAAQVEKLLPCDGAIIRAQIREQRENWKEAVGFYRTALAVRPQDPWLHSQLGAALVKDGQTAEARVAYDAALRIQPDFAQAKEGVRALDAKASN